jgi:hypothetical protein
MTVIAAWSAYLRQALVQTTVAPDDVAMSAKHTVTLPGNPSVGSAYMRFGQPSVARRGVVEAGSAD